jgi:hypothetical protein
MAKCYFTGVSMMLEESFLLDFGPALNALKHLRHRTASVQRIIDQLSLRDEVEVFNAKEHKIETKKDRRLISKAVADTLASAYPEGRLFVSWQEWKARYKTETDSLKNEIQPEDTSIKPTLQAPSSYD